VRGELVGLGCSQHPILCPVNAMICHLKHLRLHHAPLTTPIYTVFAPTPTAITTSELTQRLRQACITIGATVGKSADDISIRSLRSSGAMALLCADVDTDKIRLLGRWRSDEMLRYLHVQALPIVAPLASLMVRHGFFSFIPNNRLLG
jgi:integrase